jgi:hypothetical protein
MRPPNPKREKELHDLFLLEHTIDEAASITDVPRSTIGYYFKKFKKREKRERAKSELSRIIDSDSDSNFNHKGSKITLQYKPDEKSQINQIILREKAKLSKTKSQNEILKSVTGKFLATKDLISLIDKENYVNLFYILSCLKILNEIMQHLKLDPEELTSIMKAFQNKSQQKT